MTDLIAELAEVRKTWDAAVFSTEAHLAYSDFLRTHHAEIEAMARDNGRLRLQYAHAQAQVDHLVKILSAIHMRLYPNPIQVGEQVTVFEPENPHEWMRELTARIRAIPDEIAAMHDGAREGGES